MRVLLLGLCRGEGKIFIKANIKKSSPDNTLCVWSQGSSSTRFPCNYYQLTNDSKPDRYVLALPIVDFSQKLFVEERDSQRRRVSGFSRTVSYFRATWESRLNYRLRKKLVHDIKDFDKSYQDEQVTLDFLECIPEQSCNNIRVRIVVQGQTTIDRLSLTCIDSHGKAVVVSPTLLNTRTLPSTGQASRKTQEAFISIRIPKEIKSYCFIVHKKSEDETPVESQEHVIFNVLEKNRYSELLEQGINRIKSAQDHDDFDLMFKHNRVKQEQLVKQRKESFQISPLFSIIVLLNETTLGFFCEMVDSVRNQSYQNWELILVQTSLLNNEVINKAEYYSLTDNRIKQIALSANESISENTDTGARFAHGDFICFLDQDDLLEPNLLYEYASAINKRENIDLIYCDEDRIDGNGRHSHPRFKPDFNLDLLRNNNYIRHLICIRESLLPRIGLPESPFDEAQNYNFTLRTCEKARVIHHVGKLLYHWRASDRSVASDTYNEVNANEAGIKAVKNHLERLGIGATVEQSRRLLSYRIAYDIPREQPLVSIIIPNKDNHEILKTCIDSILAKSTYSNFELLIIENNSTSDEIFKYYEVLSSFSNIRIISFQGEFNFSKIINFGVNNTKAEFLILLNNDTELITDNWIDRMLGICLRNDVGVVGVKLYFPDDTIQHAGVTIVPDGAVHSHLNLPRTNWGYLALNDAEQDLSAVTAACLMTKRSVFDMVGGFNEQLAISYNDIDYCLKIRELELLIVYSPEVELYHYESFSRGYETTDEERQRLEKEASYMRERWARYYESGDPYYNHNLSRDSVRARYFGLDWSYPKGLGQKSREMIKRLIKGVRKVLS